MKERKGKESVGVGARDGVGKERVEWGIGLFYRRARMNFIGGEREKKMEKDFVFSYVRS